MGDIRIKIAAAAVCIGLGGLGGFAMASNPAANQAPAPLVSSPEQRAFDAAHNHGRKRSSEYQRRNADARNARGGSDRREPEGAGEWRTRQ